MAGWNHDISAAARGRYVLRAAANGKGHVKVYEAAKVILATQCGVVCLSHYLPGDKRWMMLGQGEQPVAWMPYEGQKMAGKDAAPPAHPTMPTSWFQDQQRAAA